MTHLGEDPDSFPHCLLHYYSAPGPGDAHGGPGRQGGCTTEPDAPGRAGCAAHLCYLLGPKVKCLISLCLSVLHVKSFRPWPGTWYIYKCFINVTCYHYGHISLKNREFFKGSYLFIYVFIWGRGRVWEREHEGKGRGRGRSSLPTEQGPPTQVLIPGPWDHDQSWRQTLNDWPTQAPHDYTFYMLQKENIYFKICMSLE